jgi:hypothetical protein
MVSLLLQRIFGGAHRSRVYLKGGEIWRKFTLIADIKILARASTQAIYGRYP